MLSNLSTSYNVVNVSLALPVLSSSALYASSVTEETDSVCAGSLLAGMVVGQLMGGALGDAAGRMVAMYAVMGMQILGSLGGALLVWDYGGRGGGGGGSGLGGWSVFDQLALWRFVLGVGAGGVYPLAAVLSAEQPSNDPVDGGPERCKEDEVQKLKMIAVTFSMQGVGFLLAPLLTYPLLLVLGETNLDIVWRLVLGLGALPGLVLVWLRWGQRRRRRRRGEPVPLDPPEEALETGVPAAAAGRVESGGAAVTGGAAGAADGGGHPRVCGVGVREGDEPLMGPAQAGDDDEGGGEDPPREDLISSVLAEPDLLRKLCGTAGTWFLFDVLFYGNTLFEPIVLEAAFGGSGGSGGGSANNGEDEFALLTKTARDALALSAIALPGYFVSIHMLGRMSCCGRVRQTPRYIQIQGFACMAVLYAIVGLYWKPLAEIQWLLVLLYGGTFFFANYGPNATTFALPSVTYSHRCRSTLNGISAACGKAGALLGAAAFAPLAEGWGDNHAMMLCGGVSVVAAVLTLACVGEEAVGGELPPEEEEEGRVDLPEVT